MTEETVQTAHNWIKNADAILVTASNGLSISEGLNLFANDKKLRKVVGEDLVEKYHLPNLLTAFNYKYPNQLDYWRVVSRAIEYYSNNYQASSYMHDIEKIIGDKPYFVWTSNVDYHFSLAGFKNVFEIEGNWLEGICSKHPAEHGIYQLSDKIHEFHEKDLAGTLTKADIPRCDKCGSELEINTASEDFQINQTQLTNFEKFIKDYENKALLVLELGIGPQNRMIKTPSMQLVAADPNSHYITINQGQVYISDNIADRSIGFSSSIGDAFKELLSGKSYGAKTIGSAKAKKKKVLTPKQREQQEKILNKFYPNYMVDQAFRPGSFPIYMTIDKNNLAYLHTVQYGQSLMYSMGDSAVVHCFTQNGRYYQVRLGLNKTKGDVHGFYVDPGTFIGIELADDAQAGFSQINSEIPINGNSAVLVPRKDKLIQLFPEQRAIIEKLTADEN